MIPKLAFAASVAGAHRVRFAGMPVGSFDRRGDAEELADAINQQMDAFGRAVAAHAAGLLLDPAPHGLAEAAAATRPLEPVAPAVLPDWLRERAFDARTLSFCETLLTACELGHFPDRFGPNVRRVMRRRLCDEAAFALIRECEAADAAGRDQLDLMRGGA